MAEPAGMGAEGQPTQEELQAYIEQMRQADAAEIVAQAFQVLAMGAEVKLGRSDARVLIDAVSAIVDSTGGRVPQELTTGMRTAVSQLQTAQVQSERSAGQGQTGDASRSQPAGAAQPGQRQADQGRAAAQPPPSQPSDTEAGEGGGQSMTDRLWIPGR